jgi:hypothetical protein
MQTYTPIALLSLLGLTLSAIVDRAFVTLVQLLDITTDQYILSAQTQKRGDLSPERGSGR